MITIRVTTLEEIQRLAVWESWTSVLWSQWEDHWRCGLMKLLQHQIRFTVDMLLLTYASLKRTERRRCEWSLLTIAQHIHFWEIMIPSSTIRRVPHQRSKFIGCAVGFQRSTRTSILNNCLGGTWCMKYSMYAIIAQHMVNALRKCSL